MEQNPTQTVTLTVDAKQMLAVFDQANSKAEELEQRFEHIIQLQEKLKELSVPAPDKDEAIVGLVQLEGVLDKFLLLLNSCD